MGDRKDEIIKLQMQVINQMTKNNLKRLSDDLWGAIPGVPKPQKDVQLPGLDPSVPQAPNGLPEAADVEDPMKQASAISGTPQAPVEEKEEPPEDIEDLKEELNGYIGLDVVKQEVNSLINLVNIQKMRRENDLPVKDLSLHMVFSGNPGTGKTMIARMMARIYKSLGILSKGQLVEVDRSGLVAGFVGQTAIKTSEVVQKALGGVLFVDEAYALTNHEGNDYGQEAVDTLLKAMEDHRDDLVVIVAGYTKLMDEFVHSNPGLESRFNRFLYFPDYTVEEMMAIFDMRCGQSGYELAEDARGTLKTLLTLYSLDISGFGNARGVRNLFERAVSAQADRLAQLDHITREQLMQLTAEDLLAASKATKEDVEAAEKAIAEKEKKALEEKAAEEAEKEDKAKKEDKTE